MRRYFCLALISLTTLVAQTADITGTVRDAGTQAVLPGANVMISGGDLPPSTGTATDENGKFIIERIPPGTYELKVSYIGYESHTRTFRVTTEDFSVILTIELRQDAILLQEFIVTASRGRREKLTDAPAAVSVISNIEIRRANNPNLGDYFKTVKGIDFTASGIDAYNLSARGFNTSFSSRLMTLTDGRKANVPSLRLIAYNTIPITSDDVDQIEVVLGPSSALYGPNAFAGVANIITLKPRDSKGTTLGYSIGNQDYNKWQFRHAGTFGKLGYKVSLVDFKATDWRWIDPEEVRGHHRLWRENNGEIGRQLDAGEFPTAENPWAWKFDGYDILFDRDGDGKYGGTADTVFTGDDYIISDLLNDGLIDTASFGVSNRRIDLRLDYDFAEDHSLIYSYGRADASNINVTNVARYLAENWLYQYHQLRYVNGDFFFQTYLNISDAGKTRNLRTGEHIFDQSTFYHMQVQYTKDLPWRYPTRFTWGADYQRTIPRTFGTLLPDGKPGRDGTRISYDNDGIDNDGDGKIDELAEGLFTTNEYGLYMQATSALSDHIELVVASRLDLHSGQVSEKGIRFLHDPLQGGTLKYLPQFSPKLGLLWKPSDNQTFRLTMARASITPSSQGLYLNLLVGLFPPIGVRARGNPSGYHYTRNADGDLMMLDYRAGSLTEFRLAAMPDSAVLYIPAILGRPSQFVDPADMKALEPVTSELLWTYEFGYSGIINKRLRATFDLYYSEYGNFVSDITWITPVVMDTTGGFSNAEFLGVIATAEFDGIADGGDGIPGTYWIDYGTAQWDEFAGTTGPGIKVVVSGGDTLGMYYTDDLLDKENPLELSLTNINYGSITLGGFDMSLTYFLTPQLAGDFRMSYLGRTSFFNPITKDYDPVNAPQYKLSLGVKYSSAGGRFWLSVTGRHIPTFDWSSGIFYGTIEKYTIVDLNGGYRLSQLFTLKANVNNLANTLHREIVGGAPLGRQIVINLTAAF